MKSFSIKHITGEKKYIRERDKIDEERELSEEAVV